MLPQRKPLRTLEEIDAAYPEHKKMREMEEQIRGAERLAHALHRAGICLFRRNPLDEDEHKAAVIEEVGEYDPELDPYEEFLRAYDIEDDWIGVKREFLWAALELDYDKIMAEKRDMMEQIRLAQEE
jgi:hypothetical protein